jgi:hypothetical protein
VTIFLLVYVDDIVATSSSPSAITAVLDDMCSKFALKDLGSLHYFLGIQLTRTPEGISLSQEKYVVEVLQKAGMHRRKPMKTPLSTNEKLLAGTKKALTDEEATRYRSIVGGLQYLTLTLLDISFVDNKVCQFLHAPTDVHLAAVKRIMCYVQGTLDTSLKFHSASSLKPNVFSDANWAGCPNDRCSTSGFAMYLGANIVSWSSRKQPTVSRSSTKAEYKALANATTEII